MGTEHDKGAISDIKGSVKEGVGKLTDDERLEGEGKGQQAQGDAQRGLGDVQDKLRGDDRNDRTDR
jgi:uncharacterized protein YjbJ (UPF0337 family)